MLRSLRLRVALGVRRLRARCLKWQWDTEDWEAELCQPGERVCVDSVHFAAYVHFFLLSELGYIDLAHGATVLARGSVSVCEGVRKKGRVQRGCGRGGGD